ncbi:unnamed protein product [Strongylus vulgaris]|uniref:Uncharacterized protein n=1 Tax=Strongylus vulgaris TaxID=40348 RepID=A0A3P7J8E9_STRVU|nr:unnamed protein product [Strongylus vulgaris]
MSFVVGIKDSMVSVAESIGDAISQAGQKTGEVASGAAHSVGEAVVNTKDAAADAITSAKDHTANAAQSVGEFMFGTKADGEEMADKVEDKFDGFKQATLKTMDSAGAKAQNASEDIKQGKPGEAVRNAAYSVKDKAGNAYESMKDSAQRVGLFFAGGMDYGAHHSK